MEKSTLIFVKSGLCEGALLGKITSVLAAHGERYTVIENKRQMKLDNLADYKLAISLGGDGNLITLARLCSSTRLPIIAVNAGTLGFLTEVAPDEFAAFYAQYLRGNLRAERPFLLSARIRLKSGEVLQRYAFNDVVLNREDRFLLAKIDAKFAGRRFNSYHSDGLIIASPAGSTAYNMSAGGPIIYPRARVFCLAPICSHSLTQRPIVLPKSFFVEIICSNCSLSIDGHESFAASEFSGLSVGLSSRRATLLRRPERSYFAVLKEKLHWGEHD